MQQTLSVEQAEKLIRARQLTNEEITNVEIIVRYSDGCVLVGYGAGERRVVFIDATGRAKWDMVAE